MSDDCLFCKILKGEIPSTKVYEDEKVYAFKDINPLAKEHYLFIHRSHTANVNEMSDESPEQIAEVYSGISKFTKENGLVDSGYRVVTNIGKHGCQTVFHTHFHVLGGEQLKGFGS
ncbi:MAG: histidine triad nucleotide-binding protein [Bacteriovorax sp. MedPE-SWde]|nr:MAG: histidine triad nucleotide-binding protein [Bacteriovorax sp. MedPE-SWde]